MNEFQITNLNRKRNIDFFEWLTGIHTLKNQLIDQAPMKHLTLFAVTLFLSFSIQAQDKNEAEKFWNTLMKLCGNAYEGQLNESAANDSFTGKKLIMHVRACDDKTIRIPFFVGDDKSRTWVLRLENNRITLKHDHRHEDGSEDKTTQYGGTATNAGLSAIQVFPADAYTAELIPAAATNVWWITVDDKVFSYNLRRIGSDRLFTVKFDLTKKVNIPDAPWGWKD